MNQNPIRTYRDLLEALKGFTPEQLDSNITIEHDDEFYPAALRIVGEEQNVLDPGHPVISSTVVIEMVAEEAGRLAAEDAKLRSNLTSSCFLLWYCHEQDRTFSQEVPQRQDQRELLSKHRLP